MAMYQQSRRRGGGQGRGPSGGAAGGRGPSGGEGPVVEVLTPETWERAVELRGAEEISLSYVGMALPRPGFGKIGMPCVVRANHFLIQLPERDLHHYDVSISPGIVSKDLSREIIAKLVETYKETHLDMRIPAYDGRKSLYTAGPLPFSSKEFVVEIPCQRGTSESGMRKFQVAIKFAAYANIHFLMDYLCGRISDFRPEAIQVLDVVLRAAKPSNKHVAIRRSIFSSSIGKGDLGDGLEYWRGYYQSIRPTQQGLSLIIDGSAIPCYEPVMVNEFVRKYLGWKVLVRPMFGEDRLRVKKVLKGVLVETSHMGSKKCFRVTGISREPANKLMFTLSGNGTQISVAQYFRDKYHIELKHPFLQCIQFAQRKRPMYLPMEICEIVAGQKYTKELNERQVSALLKETCDRPDIKENNIIKIVEGNQYSQNQTVSQEFGMNVSEMYTTVDARVLPPPMLKYHPSGRVENVAPMVGQWNMMNKKVFDGAVIDSWTCVNFSRMNDVILRDFCNGLVDMCILTGLKFNPDPCVPIRSVDMGSIMSALCEVHSQAGKDLQLLVIILPDIPGAYGLIKRLCENVLGIVSQCCQPKEAAKRKKQYLQNLALKINVKAGGRNNVLFDAVERNIPIVTHKPTIIFGADVTHAPPGEGYSASIAAVVASMDWPEMTKYKALVSAQAPRKEIIQDLYIEHDPRKGGSPGGMVRELLVNFWKSTHHKPDRIIFFRDGVSESQFSQVLLEEVDAIRKACQSLEEGYLPRVTFVVVQKRHHTRLFPVDHKLTDRSGNILAGTVVDTQICHPWQFDFYLCSHAGIQGTSRPTRYCVLYDESEFTADVLQLFTNSLCYTYARCTRSVSIVPPVYYAHLAASRARYHAEGLGTSDSGSSCSDEVVDAVECGSTSVEDMYFTSQKKEDMTHRKKVEVEPLPDIRKHVQENFSE